MVVSPCSKPTAWAVGRLMVVAGGAGPKRGRSPVLDIGRREFITLIGGAVAAWPLVARAQQPAVPVLGYLSARSRDDTSHLIAAFQHGLAESGYVAARNVTIEYHFAIGQYDRLPAMATELVRRPVAVIAATGGEPAVQAA